MRRVVFAVRPLGAAALVALALLAAAVWPRAGAAQQSVMIDGVRPELHLGLGWAGEVGIGARLDIPILSSGFIHALDDEFALSPGIDIAYDDKGGGELSVGGVLAAQWNFYVAPAWSIFPELGAALIYRDRNRGMAGDTSDLRVRPVIAAGGRFHFTRRNALVLRVGYPYGVQLGITF